MGIFGKSKNAGIPMANMGMMFPGINAPTVGANEEETKRMMEMYKNISVTPETKPTVIFNGNLPNINDKQGPMPNVPQPNPMVPQKTQMTRAPQAPQNKGGFDLGAMFGNIGKGILDNPALLAATVGTGLGLAGGLSPIQALGGGAIGANPILAQQQKDLEAAREQQTRLQMAAMQKPLIQSGPSTDDVLKLAKFYNVDKLDPFAAQQAMALLKNNQAFDVKKPGIFGKLFGQKDVIVSR